jgi:protein-tyrosine phosphatase
MVEPVQVAADVAPASDAIVRDYDVDAWILKYDQFQHIHQLSNNSSNSLQPVNGAPNLRQLGDLPVFGTGQPTLSALKTVVSRLGQMSDFECINWTNMRQEPVVYVNGIPFTPRDPGNLHENLQFQALSASQLQSLTATFVNVIKTRATSSNSNSITALQDTYAEHPSDRKDIKKTIAVDHIRSLKETYHAVNTELGHGEDYLSFTRFPIVDEDAPASYDLDTLLRNVLVATEKKTAFVFNCQMGKGRTTCGMVCTALILQAIETDTASPYPAPSAVEAESKLELSPTPYTHHTAPLTLRQGNFEMIQTLLAELGKIDSPETALQAKQQLDTLIDLTGPPYGLQSLRECIMWTQLKHSNGTPEQQPFWARMGKNFVKRYYVLICFAFYLATEQSTRFALPFHAWVQKHHAVNHLLTDSVPGFQWR